MSSILSRWRRRSASMASHSSGSTSAIDAQAADDTVAWDTAGPPGARERFGLGPIVPWLASRSRRTLGTPPGARRAPARGDVDEAPIEPAAPATGAAPAAAVDAPV